MNLSATGLVEARERDGEATDDRPEYVEEALTPDKRVGYRDGLPLVEPPEGLETSDMRLGDDVGALYEHYRRGESLLLPEAGNFLRRLFESEHVESVADAAEELNTERETVEKATNLHGIDVPTEGGAEEDTETIEELELPSSERIPLALLSDPPHRDKLVLAQLLSVGFSMEESAQYLSKETGERVTSSDVRTACQEHNLLSGGGDSTAELVAPAERTATADDSDVANSPW